MRLYEFDLSQANTPMSFWGLADLLGLKQYAENMDDLALPWLNHNKPACINKMLNDTKYHQASLLKLYWDTQFKHKSWTDPIGSYAGLKAFLASPMTFWRGGGGEYDPNYTGNGWFAYTYSRDRVQTFTDYDGTYASKSQFLSKRQGESWVVELTIPVGEIGLYLHNSMDSEVIIPAHLSATARQIK
jgi:hypothetical protein